MENLHFPQQKTLALTVYNILHEINISLLIFRFTVECGMKLLALHYKYFTIPWNVFDFIIVIASILGMHFFTFEFFMKKQKSLFSHIFGKRFDTFARYFDVHFLLDNKKTKLLLFIFILFVIIFWFDGREKQKSNLFRTSIG
jgi:hypothetical protein